MQTAQLKEQLLTEISNIGFCQDLFLVISRKCSEWLKEHISKSPDPYVLIHVYLLREVSQNIESYLGSIEPINSAKHARIKSKIINQLEAAIGTLDSDDPSRRIGSISVLIIAFNLLR